MHAPFRVLPPAAAFVGRVTVRAAEVASAPVQRRSLRNAQAAIALHRASTEGPHLGPITRDGEGPAAH